MTADPTRTLRYYGGLAVLIFAIGPPLMLSLLISQNSVPRSVAIPLAVGIPINLMAVYFAVRGMAGRNPDVAGRYIGAGCGLVAVGDVLMVGGNALLN